VEAAAELGDPRLHPALEQLRDDGWATRDPIPDVLDEALAACAPDGPAPARDRPTWPPGRRRS
jgi:hypothetical protein